MTDRGSNLTMLSDVEIEMSRTFDAPRDLVFRAHTDPALIPRWWGLRANETVVDAMDVRPGGAWRFVERAPDGSEHAFRGEYREIVPPERLAYTFEYEGMPGHVLVETITFTEQDGRTTLISRSRFDTKEDRDGMLASGMESGAIETYDRLAEVLAELQAEPPVRS